MSILTIDQMSKEELRYQRDCYAQSIKRLKNGWNKLSYDAKFRAGHTLLNLRNQMARIDALQAE
jgi:hypothetical protein